MMVKLRSPEKRVLELVRDKSVIIYSNYGAPFIERNRSPLSANTIRSLIRKGWLDSQHDGAWNSDCTSHQITKEGERILNASSS